MADVLKGLRNTQLEVREFLYDQLLLELAQQPYLEMLIHAEIKKKTKKTISDVNRAILKAPSNRVTM